MKKHFFTRWFITAVLFISVQQKATAQDQPVLPIVTADSLASGNYKDVLTSFFQLAFNRFTSDQKELTFTSNPYAIMLRGNPKLAIDTSYYKYRALRNLNFSITTRLDTNFRFNGFSSAITYALINRRDYTVYHEFNDLARLKNKEYEALTDGIAAAASALPPDNDLRKRLRTQGNQLLNDSNFSFNQLDADVKVAILGIIKSKDLQGISRLLKGNENLNVYQSIHEGYEAVKKSFQNRLLWTVGLSDTTYNNQFVFSNIGLNTRLLKGVSNPDKASNLEVDLNAGLNFVDDTLKSGRDLKRLLLYAETGVNWVYKSKYNRQSLMELKFSASYNRIFSGIYKDETKELFTLNGNFRIRIYEDIWVPVQFKYDPKNGNVFGWLSVKFNFNSLKKVIAGGK